MRGWIIKKLLPRAMRLTNVGWLCSLMLLAASWQINAASQPLAAFKAEYVAYHFGQDLGKASITLTALGRDRYKLSYMSDLSMLFLSDKRQETSLFSYQNGQFTPYKYQYSRTGTGSDKSLEARFDGRANTITLGNGDTLPWQGELDNQIYRLQVQQQVAQGQQQVTYAILNYRGQLREYQIKILGEENLQLPYGKLDAIKASISRANQDPNKPKKRETFVWFAPALNYHLVKLQQYKNGEEQGRIELRQLTQ